MNYEEIYNILSGPAWSNSEKRKFIETLIEWYGLTDDIRTLIEELEVEVNEF